MKTLALSHGAICSRPLASTQLALLPNLPGAGEVEL